MPAFDTLIPEVIAEMARVGGDRIARLAERSGKPGAGVVIELAALLKLPLIDAAELDVAAPAFDALPFVEASRRSCLPIRAAGGALTLVVSDPLDADLQAFLEYRVAEPFTYAIAAKAHIEARLAIHGETLRALDDVSISGDETGHPSTGGEDLSIEGISEAASPVVQLVNAMIHDALKAQASDIHLESTVQGLTVKYRLDGVLVEMRRVTGVQIAEQAISRLKVMSQLDIAERRVPQDGRFRGLLRSREIDFRVSIMPSVHGEDAVIRILDKRALADGLTGLTLDKLGFDSSIIEAVRDLAALPYGMLLVTGPTGSGKTTSLYAVLSETQSSADKIITIEDPVEYQLSGVLQIPVNERKGLTFARGLRSILRHDPDRIMVGEIRDSETAEISIQAALTGHLVYTTVHANNVLDVLGRFLHMQVDTYNFVSAVNGVLAQRLIRVNCEACARQHAPEEALLRRSRVPEGFADTARFMQGTGCEACRGTGYRGRRAIAELLVMSDEIREAIIAREPARALKARAAVAGTRSLREAVLDLVVCGQTTLEEANRVTFALQ